VDALHSLLSSQGFMPHGHCYLWTPGLLWTNIISDSLIALSYFTIPVTLVFFAQRRRDIPFSWVFVAFGVFILACGATHVMDVWTTWNPDYWLLGFVKAATAGASVPTAILLVRLMPQALLIPSPQQLAQVNAQLTAEIAERKRVEQGLRREEERFRKALEHAPIGMAIVSLDGTFAQVNRALCAIVGYDKAELESLNFKHITHTEDLSGNRANMQRMLNGEIDSYQMEKRYLRKDGSTVWVQETSSLLRDDQGHAMHSIAQVQDITKRKQAEAELRSSEERVRTSEARLQAFMDHSPSVMFVKDLAGRYVHVNHEFTRVFALSRDQIIAHTDAQLFPAEQAAQFEANDAKVLADDAPIQVEEHALYEDGAHTSLVCKFPIHDDDRRVAAIGGVVTDITQRKKAELAIRLLNEDLEHRTAQLTAANADLELFCYSVAHDLRAPLRHILGFASILTEEHSAQLDTEAQRYLGKVHHGAQQMGHLVDALLSLAKVGQKELALELTPLDGIVRAVLHDLESECAQREVEWNIGTLSSIQCDPRLMKQVFFNLLSNALKYTRPRARAVIEVGRTGTGAEAVIFVRDNGVGFDMHYASKLFGVFERLHKANDFEGTGVGLAIVERIIRNHGGRIWAEAEPDRGATFFFTLGPAAQPVLAPRVSIAQAR
jgi:PAS domain S-box-containing protein